MTKTLSMVSHKNNNLNANEDFVIFFTSKTITWLLNESEHIYWIWDLEGEVHSIWDLWVCGLEKCEGNGLFEVGRVGNNFWSGPKNQD
jgi:hypothetical protein